jgi:hypothetical protein
MRPSKHSTLRDSNAAEAAALARRIIADAKSGAFRGIAFAYVSAHGEEIHAERAAWFDLSDGLAALTLANQVLELVKPGLDGMRVAPPPASSRVN